MTIESVLRMDLPSLRRNTYLIAPMCLAVAAIGAVLGVIDEPRRPLWWAIVAVELFVGPILILGRLRYFTVIQAVQDYAAKHGDYPRTTDGLGVEVPRNSALNKRAFLVWAMAALGIAGFLGSALSARERAQQQEAVQQLATQLVELKAKLREAAGKTKATQGVESATRSESR